MCRRHRLPNCELNKPPSLHLTPTVIFTDRDGRQTKTVCVSHLSWSPEEITDQGEDLSWLMDSSTVTGLCHLWAQDVLRGACEGAKWLSSQQAGAEKTGRSQDQDIFSRTVILNLLNATTLEYLMLW